MDSSHDNDWHEYSEINRNNCQTCADIYKRFGPTDAQIEDYHVMVPIRKEVKEVKNPIKNT